LQTIELYIQGQRVSLFKDESVTITDTIKNIRDVSNVFTTFSQQFTVPADKINNLIFKHYYNFDIINGFDARVKVDGEIKLNGVNFRAGKVKLNSVTLKENKAYDYKIVFFGNGVDLNTLVGEDLLSNLQFIEDKSSGASTSVLANHLVDAGANFNNAVTGVSEGDRIENVSTGDWATIIDVVSASELELNSDIFTGPAPENYQVYLSPIYENDAVKAKLQLPPTYQKNSVVVPLISHTARLIYDGTIATNTEEPPVKNIEYNAAQIKGIDYTDLKFAVRIDEIIKAIENTYKISNGFPQSLVFTTDFFNTSNANYYSLFMWLNRNLGPVQTSTSVSAFQFTANNFTGGAVGVGVDPYETGYIGSGTSVWIAPDQGLTYFELTVTPDPTNVEDFNIAVMRNGINVYSADSVTPTTNMTILPADLGLTTATAVGTYSVIISANGGAKFSSIEFDCSGQYTSEDALGNISTQTFTNQIAGTSAGFTMPAIPTFDIGLQMPEMKVIDFLTSLFKMFNLIAFLNDDGDVEVRTLDNASADSYYNLPTIQTWDISNYIDIKSSTVDVALPFSAIAFAYEDLKTFLALKHGQLFNEQWGTEAWNDDSSTKRIAGSAYKVTVPYQHQKYERFPGTTIQYGWSVNESQSAYKGKPLLFYPILNTGDDVSYIEGGAVIPIDPYVIPSNSRALAAATSEDNINFGPMVNEYEGISFAGTLFQNYYYNYITNIFKVNARVVRVTAYLPLRIILNYQLNDFIIINFKKYRINSIKINLLTNKSQLELITI